MLLLVAAHVPLMITYLSVLWQETHYQFFPFAIGAFIWLMVTRRSQEPQRWTLFSRLLIAADLCCLAYGYFDPSPWVAAAGLVALATAWALSYGDAGYSRSLGYLGLLPLLVVRLPLKYDKDIIDWLQRITTSISSRALNRLELLHVRDGNVIEFPGKTFLVGEACSGVQSLFTILFLAALVTCLKRRSIIHGIVLLGTGVIFAGIMNVVRVVTIAAAWDLYSMDLSLGWSHDVLGYLCLMAAALMLISTDAFLGFLTDSIPDIQRPGPVGLFRNPLIMLWNRTMTVMPAASLRGAAIAGPSRSETEKMSDTEHRTMPSSAELLRPANWFHFSLGLAENWIFSRAYGRMAAGLPFLATAVCGVLLIWWLRHASEAPILAAYESAYNAATQNGDAVRQETYLRALSLLRSDDPQYRFRYGQFLVTHGRTGEGLDLIEDLAAEPNLGSADARKWLVMQALSDQPFRKMPAEEIERQLQRVLAHLPHDADAHELLAQQYLNRKEWRLAEQHLSEAARTRPELNLKLAQLKSDLKRSPDDVLSCARQAIEALEKRLEQDRSDAVTRISLAEALIIAERDAEARETLVSGLNQKDDPRLRAALCGFDLMLVERRLRESGLNRDACLPLALNAMQIDPSNEVGIRVLTTLHALGAVIPAESVEQSLTHWQTVVEQQPDDTQSRLMLCQLLVITGDSVKSAESMRPLLDTNPELRLTFAKLLIKGDQKDEGLALLETLVSESQSKLTETPGDIAAAVVQAGALLALERPESARMFLTGFAADLSGGAFDSDPRLTFLFGQSCIDRYDQLTGDSHDSARSNESTSDPAPSDADIKTLLTLLSDALRCPSTTHLAIDRLAKLSLSSHPAAADAEAMVRQLRLEGPQGIQALNLLGMHANLMQRFDIAQRHLEQANALAQGRNPMVLNNLAIAIIRGGSDSRDHDRAMGFVNAALTQLKGHPDALATRAEIYLAKQQWPEALADLKSSLSSGRNTVEVHRLLEREPTWDSPMLRWPKNTADGPKHCSRRRRPGSDYSIPGQTRLQSTSALRHTAGHGFAVF